jgi:hypothetical protein
MVLISKAKALFRVKKKSKTKVRANRMKKRIE